VANKYSKNKKNKKKVGIIESNTNLFNEEDDKILNEED